MFRALNSFISRLDADPPPGGSPSYYQNKPLDGSTYGFQVLKNTNRDLSIEPWFDFIVGINGRVLDSPDAHLFATEVRNCAGGNVSLELWSAKGQRNHSLTIPVDAASPFLGLTLQLAPLSTTQNIWHILNIPSPLSPAYTAGLLPHSDYILGTPSGTLRGEAAFGELVEDHLNRSLVLWVYNSEFDVVREVELVPRRGWGGEGALGAELGYGALHRLPIPLGEEMQGPGESLFEAGSNRPSMEKAASGAEAAAPQYLVPANLTSPPPAAPPPMMNPTAPPTSSSSGGRPARKTRHAGALSPNRVFDDYFKEGEQKSKEEDYVPPRKNTPVAPPPKIGEAAKAEARAEEAVEGEPGPAEENDS